MVAATVGLSRARKEGKEEEGEEERDLARAFSLRNVAKKRGGSKYAGGSLFPVASAPLTERERGGGELGLSFYEEARYAKGNFCCCCFPC